MFLVKVYKEWKTLFWILLILVAGQFYFMQKGIENAPFFVYGMFAGVYPVKDSFDVLLIKKDNQYVSPFGLSNREAELLTNNVEAYLQLKKNAGDTAINKTIHQRFGACLSASIYQYVLKGLTNSQTSINQYPHWWMTYFKSTHPSDFKEISIVKSTVIYFPQFHKSAVDKLLISFDSGK